MNEPLKKSAVAQGFQSPQKLALTVISAFSPLIYHDGPIISTPELVSFYWGSFTSSEINGMQAWLAGMAGYLSNLNPPPGQEQVVLQYGVCGAFVGAFHSEATAPSAAVQVDVKNKILALQGTGQLPPFSPRRILLVFTKGISFPNYGLITTAPPQGEPSVAWCGYHSNWGIGSYFAICPFPEASGCGSSSQIPNWQSSTSHELLETATDPMPPQGWSDSGGGEGGDPPPCNFVDLTLSFGNVQKFADNQLSTCSVWTTRRSDGHFQVLRRNGNATGWDTLDGLATDIAVGANGDVWAIGIPKDAGPGGFPIFQWDEAHLNFHSPLPGNAVRIAVGPNGRPWLVNSLNQVLRRNGNATGWDTLDGLATDIAVGANGDVWAIGIPKDTGPGGFPIYKWDEAHLNFNSPLPGRAIGVAVGPEGRPWLVNL